MRITIFGASHAPEVGVIIEGVPQGMHLTPDMFMRDIDRRRPALRGETPRHEEDIPHIEGLNSEQMTTGGRIVITFQNSNTRSADYSRFERQPRPSHADLVQRRKYGREYDISGGGMASGRMTAAIVAAGVVAKQVLEGVSYDTRLVSVGSEHDPAKFESTITAVASCGDSIGGIVECRVRSLPACLGEPFFDSAESVIAHLLFAIPAVKGVEFGDGFAGTKKLGSKRNDMIINAQGSTLTNNEGGINGGITNGNDLVVRVAIKPTASISLEQRTFDLEQESIAPLTIGGRHDACIARRAQVVVEAAVAIALADLKLRA